MTAIKHPYGRLASMRHGALEVATGLVVLLTLGEVQPRWVLDNAIATAMRHSRRQREQNGSTLTDGQA